jgi:hypothetical protein
MRPDARKPQERALKQNSGADADRIRHPSGAEDIRKFMELVPYGEELPRPRHPTG